MKIALSIIWECNILLCLHKEFIGRFIFIFIIIIYYYYYLGIIYVIAKTIIRNWNVPLNLLARLGQFWAMQVHVVYCDVIQVPNHFYWHTFLVDALNLVKPNKFSILTALYTFFLKKLGSYFTFSMQDLRKVYI